VCAQVAARLGMPPSEIELAEFLVRQHLTMSHLSQRRDLSDPEVISRFGEKVVRDDEHLVQLYLLTLCDTAMTAPDNLSAWKDGLLRELVVRTRAFFNAGNAGKGTSTEATAAVDDGLRSKIIELAGAEHTPIVDGFDPRLFVQLTPRQTARHVKLIAAVRASGAPKGADNNRVGVEVHCWPLKGHSEVAIVAPDEPGVLATLAGALTANRVDVLGAVLGHVDLPEGRLVVDVFYVRDLKGAAITEDDPRWARLGEDLRALLPPDPAKVATLIARRRPRSGMPKRVTPGVITEIKLADESNAATIVEVATLDRAGVLYAITQTLADLGLDISLAKVATEGEKVADVFYVTRAGKRITDDAERTQLVARLRAAVEAPGLTGT
jgi:[protein-PII] uridylyltransferase